MQGGLFYVKKVQNSHPNFRPRNCGFAALGLRTNQYLYISCSERLKDHNYIRNFGPTLVMCTNKTFLEFTRSQDQHTIERRGKPLRY